ncbi:MAG TPA: hypothetical protein VMH24_08080, partial [Candidatus Sulfotelmatobacter sp.]|nr:hypothetical protein [Candidatus Sulfotelmatobacter sp.]
MTTIEHLGAEQRVAYEERAHEAQALVRAWDGRAGGFGGWLGRVGGVDQVAVNERVASLAKRSIKRDSKLWALDLAIRMMDLTTLEGKDTPGKVASLCRKALRPDEDAEVPAVAAVCVYPALVRAAKSHVADSGVKVASVATAFPSGQFPLKTRLAE